MARNRLCLPSRAHPALLCSPEIHLRAWNGQWPSPARRSPMKPRAIEAKCRTERNAMTVKIHHVINEKDKRDFYNFAWRVYRNDPCWVPHLWPQRKAYLDRKAAFFSYGEGEFWLAMRGVEIVGTIGTAIDPSYNQSLGERAATFGFFEMLEGDYETAAAMWDFACDWARQKGMAKLRGPYSFSPNEDNGFLIEGFQYPPAVLLGHTPPYYAIYAEKYGFQKEAESLAYRIELADFDFDVNKAPEILHRIAARSRQRYGESAIYHPNMKDWENEVAKLHSLYNRSLAVLPGFAPLELAEFQAQAEALRTIIDPELVFIAEVDGKPVGFGLGLPNIMEALSFSNGFRRPWDILRFAWAQRRIRSASFKILAIDPEYWGRGLEALMFLEMGKAAIRKGYTWLDGSLTGEDNPQTNKLAARFGARVYRRYRTYWLKL